MTKTLGSLFSVDNNDLIGQTDKKLVGSAELVRLADIEARKICKMADEDDQEDGRVFSLVAGSVEDPSKLDEVVNELYQYEADSLQFLVALPDDTLVKLMKSQQSKRSRIKGMSRNQDNYIKMLSAAIAEHMIRKTLNKPKGKSGKTAGLLSPNLTSEEVEMYSADQLKLGAAIRNLQSQKSIFKKNNADYEETEKWQTMLSREAELKSLRTSVPSVMVKDDPRIDKIIELVAELDINSMKVHDVKEVLRAVRNIVTIDESDDESEGVQDV